LLSNPENGTRWDGRIVLTATSVDPNPANNEGCETTVMQAHRGDCNAGGGADAGDLACAVKLIFEGPEACGH